MKNFIRMRLRLRGIVRSKAPVMSVIDFIIEVLFVPGPIWVGTLLGILVASAVWFLLPETVDRVSVYAWIVVAGFVGGCLYGLPSKKDK